MRERVCVRESESETTLVIYVVVVLFGGLFLVWFALWHLSHIVDKIIIST